MSKESKAIRFLINAFPQYSWKTKPIPKIRLRPDLYVDLGHRVICIEIDQHQHKYGNYKNEESRMYKILKKFGKPVIFIRFNPDEYKNINNEIIKSCWKEDKYGILVIDDENKWLNRLNRLKSRVTFWMNPNNKITETEEKLFYDKDHYDEVIKIDDSESESDNEEEDEESYESESNESESEDEDDSDDDYNPKYDKRSYKRRRIMKEEETNDNIFI